MAEKATLRPAERLIVALDLDGVEKATRLVETLVPLGVTHFKVGLGLFTLAGPEAVERVQGAGGQVFLDLKFHDIPSTVARCVQAAARLGVWMMNLHIQGGSAMMRRAAAAVKEESQRSRRPPPLLIGVTVLTSMAQRDLADLGLRKTLKEQVLYLAKLARSAGLDGIVASAQEAKVVRWACGDDFVIVTPGIRPGAKGDPFSSSPHPSPLSEGEGGVERGVKGDDQSRTATAAEAMEAGADYLVVGRPILQAPDPKAAVTELLKECEKK